MGRNSRRHYRDESDPLLGFYSQNLATSSTNQNLSNPLYAASNIFSILSHKTKEDSPNEPLLQASMSDNRRGRADDHHGNRNTPVTVRNHPSSWGTYRAHMDGEVSSTPSARQHIPKRKKKKPHGYRVHRVSYTAHDHIQVLFRAYGSAFPKVFPFVVANVFWSCFVNLLKYLNIADWTFHSSVGHSFMGLLVSFLIVSRSQISYSRFMEYRKLLSSSYRICREIAQFTTIYTFYTNTPQAKAWRQEVCYRTILMLRVTMDALLWSSTERSQWEDEYYHNELVDDSKEFSVQEGSSCISEEDGEEDDHKFENNSGSFASNGSGTSKQGDKDEETGAHRLLESDNVSEHFFRFRELTHGRRSRIDESFRAPITMMHLLETIIMEHPQYLGYKMAVNEYRDIVLKVNEFDTCFHGFRVLVFTPYPFPLMQMSRASLFFWVYTLPLVLLEDYRLWSSILIIVFVTFGFIGIEYVSMALDDPFSDDTNDVDEHGMALLVYEDIYMALYRTDGHEAAVALRERVLERYKRGRSLDNYRADLMGYTIWETAVERHQRLGPHPDWSRNPTPAALVDPPQRVATFEMPSAKSTTRSRRPPTHPYIKPQAQS